MADGKVIARGVVAKMRGADGDTVAPLLNGGPSDSDASAQSNQLKTRTPSGIAPQAIQNAGKRHFVALANGFDGGTKKAPGKASGDPGGQSQSVALDSGNGGGKAPGRKS